MSSDEIKNTHLSLLGFGNMGQAIVKGLLRKNIFLPSQIFVFDPADDKQQDAKNIHLQLVTHIEDLLNNSKILLVAVKPQMIQSALQPLIASIGKEVLIISIAAGISIHYYKNLLGKSDLRIVRTMPNTPALVGEGITAISFSEQCSEQDKILAQRIFQSVGKTVLVSEEQIDIVTAVSGSGPAYFFYLCECMIEAGKSLGLSEEIALSLVRQTFYGSASLLMSGDDLPEVLRARVTSKGGTTESAIKTMEGKNLKSIVIEAIHSAYHRARELGK
ncbi:MAG: pyrroline-5-carboxylate reductase [Candidatus Hydrogenedens sp.]